MSEVKGFILDVICIHIGFICCPNCISYWIGGILHHWITSCRSILNSSRRPIMSSSKISSIKHLPSVSLLLLCKLLMFHSSSRSSHCSVPIICCNICWVSGYHLPINWSRSCTWIWLAHSCATAWHSCLSIRIVSSWILGIVHWREDFEILFECFVNVKILGPIYSKLGRSYWNPSMNLFSDRACSLGCVLMILLKELISWDLISSKFTSLHTLFFIKFLPLRNDLLWSIFADCLGQEILRKLAILLEIKLVWLTFVYFGGLWHHFIKTLFSFEVYHSFLKLRFRVSSHEVIATTHVFSHYIFGVQMLELSWSCRLS
jgi:hypothetical protein